MAHSPACGRRSSLSGGVSCRTPLGDLTFPLSKADRPSVRCTATGESDPDRTPSSLGLTEFRLGNVWAPTLIAPGRQVGERIALGKLRRDPLFPFTVKQRLMHNVARQLQILENVGVVFVLGVRLELDSKLVLRIFSGADQNDLRTFVVQEVGRIDRRETSVGDAFS